MSEAKTTFAPWWRRLAGAILIFDGVAILLYGPILPVPPWLLEPSIPGGMPWVAVLAGAALIGVGIGAIQHRQWARSVGIAVGLAYAALDAALALANGSILLLLEAVVPLFVVFVLGWRWGRASALMRDPA